MTLQRAGRIDGRAFAEVIDLSTGRPDRYVCLSCMRETEADFDAFRGHDCRKKPRITERASPDLPFDTHEMSVDEARPLIAELEADVPTLLDLKRHEQNHPTRPRKGVLDALEERIGERTAENAGLEPSRGLAREPVGEDELSSDDPR